MVSNLNWIIEKLDEYFKSIKSEIGFKENVNFYIPYKTTKKSNPKIIVSEIQNIAVDFTNNGERKTLIGVQIEIYCGGMKIFDNNESGYNACEYISGIVDGFMTNKMKSRRVGNTSPMPSSADDTNEFVAVLRYEYNYDTSTNTIYR